MTTFDLAGAGGADAGLLDRARTIAAPGYNRWLVPPAALAIHLCIGMSYGLSVFWLPLSNATPAARRRPARTSRSATALFTTACNWRVSDLLVIFTIGIVVLGVSAALFGGWLERAGPRKAGFVAALCWGGGFLGAALGVFLHQLWIIWLSLGLVGGVGLGLGYISPVSTLVKWFPDRRGMATGMAIMGFGGGAMIGSPLANLLMNNFKTADSVGVWQTMATLGVIYLCVMMAGALRLSLARRTAGGRPAGAPPAARTCAMITHGVVASRRRAQDAAVLADLGGALPQRLGRHRRARDGVADVAGDLRRFADRLTPRSAFPRSTPAQKTAIATIAAGLRRPALAVQHRRPVLLGVAVRSYRPQDDLFRLLRPRLPALRRCALARPYAGRRPLFVASFCVILSMYGGGFATVPAYLADIFGPRFVGAIHGRLLTAWSTAGVVGPLVVGYIRDAQIAAGVERARVYDRTLYILSSFLVVGFLCNALISARRLEMADDAGATRRAAGFRGFRSGAGDRGAGGRPRPRRQGAARLGRGLRAARLGRLENPRQRRENFGNYILYSLAF